MKPEDLRKLQEESYDTWFKRWYEKENLPNKLKQSAMEGYSGYELIIHAGLSDHERRRKDDERFVKKLKEKLPDFKIYKRESKKREMTILGRRAGYVWSDPEVVISWRENK